jgi:hypothetical protein
MQLLQLLHHLEHSTADDTTDTKSILTLPTLTTFLTNECCNNSTTASFLPQTNVTNAVIAIKLCCKHRSKLATGRTIKWH